MATWPLPTHWVGALGFALTSSLSLGNSSLVPVRVPAARKKGLIISEFAFNSGVLPGVTGYSNGGYFEIYNNGDTTVYLDGMLVGEAIALPFKTNYATCQDQDRLKYDPLFLWTHASRTDFVRGTRTVGSAHSWDIPVALTASQNNWANL